jgi:hypothetical protein
LSIEGIRDEISWVWDPTAYKAFLSMLTDHGNPEACFFSGIKGIFMENRGCNDLRRATKGGYDAVAYLYAILFYRDNGGAAADNTAKQYMRRVAGSGSTTSRWLSNEGCLPLREKVARETTRISAVGIPNLSTSVVVPGGLPRAIPVSAIPKSIQKGKNKEIEYNIYFITLIRVHLFGTCRVQVQQD